MYRVNVKKPIYIRADILDLGKLLMKFFHYNCIKIKYSHKSEMLFIDTNSVKLAH